MKELQNQNEVLKQFHEMDGNKYDHSQFKYVSEIFNSTFICSEHGEFNTTVKSHRNGSGCAHCVD